MTDMVIPPVTGVRLIECSNALIDKAIGGSVWDNRSEAARCANTERPLTHLVDRSDRQDEMKTTQERFWSKVSPPNEQGCMLWLGGKSSDGYGGFWFAGATRSAHRVALILTEGEPLQPELEAAHSCRHRDCVAPLHLRWATRRENEGDKVGDQTLIQGDQISHSKLIAEQVLVIRADHAAGESIATLARRYSVTRRAIRFIVNRDTWAWLEEAS